MTHLYSDTNFADLSNLRPLEAMGRGSETQLPVGEHLTFKLLSNKHVYPIWKVDRVLCQRYKM